VKTFLTVERLEKLRVMDGLAGEIRYYQPGIQVKSKIPSCVGKFGMRKTFVAVNNFSKGWKVGKVKGELLLMH
jgi:hypothetical protein